MEETLQDLRFQLLDPPQLHQFRFAPGLELGERSVLRGEFSGGLLQRGLEVVYEAFRIARSVFSALQAPFRSLKRFI